MITTAPNDLLWEAARNDDKAAIFMATPEPFLAAYALTGGEYR